MTQSDHLETRVTHAGQRFDPDSGSMVPPLHTATTFGRDAEYELIGDHAYARDSHPNADLIEDAMTGVCDGVDALAFSSGMSGFACLMETVPSGARVVAPTVMYHGAMDWLHHLATERGVTLALFDAADPAGLTNALSGAPADIVWIESPVNPTWDVIDIAAAAEAAHAAGALLAVDSTVAPPVTTKTLELGADIEFHSATKYLNGHSDVTAGILITKAASDRWERIKWIRTHTGGIISPFAAWLLTRGLRTLHVRFERSSANALALAEHFEHHPALESVMYPGLASHPSHDVAKRQMTSGFGGMLSVLAAGGEDAARKIASSTRVFSPATSLGGVESLIEHRAVVEGPHSVVPRNLLRVSVGIEHADDLIADLETAFEAAQESA